MTNPNMERNYFKDGLSMIFWDICRRPDASYTGMIQIHVDVN